MVRSKFKKIIVILLIILTINNFIMNASFADNQTNVDSRPAWQEGLIEIAGSIIGLFTFPIRLIAMGAAWGINILTASVAYIEGATEDSSASSITPIGNVNLSIITPFDIFFNRVKILDVNFFDIGNDTSLVTQIRTNVAIWFYVLRNIAIIILLAVLLYVGIKMAITTIATDKAMYKKMLFDWTASLMLVFIIQYIIIFTVSVNQSIIKAIEFGVNSEEISNTFGVISELAYNVTDLDSIAATVIFCMLVWQTLGLVISYFNRMLKIAFLIIISPLITLTYSIDKMGDGKAQALGGWLKEFVYTILIQPFHCIIYMCFVNIAFNLLINNTQGDADNSTLGIAVVSILCVHFVKEAEKLIRKIFAFKDDNSSTSMTAGLAVAGMALSKSKSIGQGARGMINGAKGTASALSASMTGVKVGLMARSLRRADKASGENSGKTLDEYKEDARTKINDKKAEKMEKKYKVASGKAGENNEHAKQIEEAADAIMATNPGMTRKEARSIARLNAAKKVRSQKGIRKPINKVRGAINKVKKAADSSEVLKGISGLTKFSVSAGMGMMVGSGIYGTNGNIGTALAAGAATFNATKAFQKTAGTFEKSISENLEGLGVKDKEEATKVCQEFANNPELYGNGEQATKQMEQILDRLGNALIAAGMVDASNKNKIKNMIEKGIKADPSKTPQIIQNALKSVGGDKVDLLTANNGNVLRETQNLANYLNKKEIYNKMQSAADFNISPDLLLGGAIERVSYEDTRIDIEKEKEVNNSEEIVDSALEEESINPEIDDTLLSNLSNNQIEFLEEEFERRREELLNRYDNVIAEGESEDKEKNNRRKEYLDRLEEELKEIERIQVDTISRALAKNKEKVKAEMIQKYKKLLDEKIDEYDKSTRSDTDIGAAKLIRMKKTQEELKKV